MKLFGFSLSKIGGEKKNGQLKDLKIESKLDVKDIVEAKQSGVKIDDELLAISFTYDIFYKENIGKLNLEGSLVIGVDSEKKKEIFEQWKDKKMSDDFRVTIFNIIMRKSAIKMLDLEETIGLPPHIQFPVLKKQK